MDILPTITIVAGLAGILGFLYLVFVGQRNLFEWWRDRKASKENSKAVSALTTQELPPPVENTKITLVMWDTLITAVDRFASECQKEYDLIVGIAMGGLPIAVSLTHRLPNTRFSAMLKRYVNVRQAPFFIFEDESHRRSNRKRIIDSFTLPVHDKEVKRILVVDDVTTFGNSLEAAELLIKEQLKDAEVDFFVYAVDVSRLGAAKPELSMRVKYHREIDNRLEWLQFPWERG